MKTIFTKKIWVALFLAIAIAAICSAPVFADRNSDVNVAADYLVQWDILRGDDNGDLKLD
jgi:hypothetical protein